MFYDDKDFIVGDFYKKAYKRVLPLLSEKKSNGIWLMFIIVSAIMFATGTYIVKVPTASPYSTLFIGPFLAVFTTILTHMLYDDPNNMVMETYNKYRPSSKLYFRIFVIIVITQLLIFLGYLLFFIPGIFLAYTYNLAPLFFVHYHKTQEYDITPKMAMSESRLFMTGHRIQVFLVSIPLALMAGVAIFVAAALGILLIGFFSIFGSTIASVATFFVMMLLGAIGLVAAVFFVMFSCALQAEIFNFLLKKTKLSYSLVKPEYK